MHKKSGGIKRGWLFARAVFFYMPRVRDMPPKKDMEPVPGRQRLMRLKPPPPGKKPKVVGVQTGIQPAAKPRQQPKAKFTVKVRQVNAKPGPVPGTAPFRPSDAKFLRFPSGSSLSTSGSFKINNVGNGAPVTPVVNAKATPYICEGFQGQLDPGAPARCLAEGMLNAAKKTEGEKQRRFQATGKQCDGFSLNTHQAVIVEYARTMMTRGPENMNGHRSLLCWHSVGSGKTVLALGIAIAAKKASAARNEPFRVVIATTQSNKRDNDPKTYAENLANYYPHEIGPGKAFDFKDDPPPPPGSPQIKAWAARVAGGSTGGVKGTFQFITFKTYTSTWITSEQPSNGKLVVIMDECQNLIKPDSRNLQYEKQIKGIRDHLMNTRYQRNIHVFGLTGTPSSGSVADIVDLLDLHRPVGVPAYAAAAKSFEQLYGMVQRGAFNGMVSYVEARADKTVFGAVVDDQDSGAKNMVVPMGARYYLAYLNAVSRAAKAAKEFRFDPKKPDSFLATARVKSTVLNATDYKGILDDTAPEARKFVVSYGNKKMWASAKLYNIFRYITTRPGKHFVWCGHFDVAKALEGLLQSGGYERLAIKGGVEAQEDLRPDGEGAPGDAENKSEQHGWYKKARPKKRYMRYGTGQLDAVEGYRHGPKREMVTDGHLKPMRDIFGDDKNMNGEYVQIILTMGQSFEGLNIKGLASVHAAYPLPTQGMDRQWVGRALRACGHKKSPKKTVDVFRWISVKPPNFDVNAAAQGIGKRSFDAEGLVRYADAFGGKALTGCCGKSSGDANSIVYSCAVSRKDAENLEDFQGCLKRRAIDCAAYADTLHANLKPRIPCGQCAAPGSSGAACPIIRPSSTSTTALSSVGSQKILPGHHPANVVTEVVNNVIINVPDGPPARRKQSTVKKKPPTAPPKPKNIRHEYAAQFLRLLEEERDRKRKKQAPKKPATQAQKTPTAAKESAKKKKRSGGSGFGITKQSAQGTKKVVGGIAQPTSYTFKRY